MNDCKVDSYKYKLIDQYRRDKTTFLFKLTKSTCFQINRYNTSGETCAPKKELKVISAMFENGTISLDFCILKHMREKSKE